MFDTSLRMHATRRIPDPQRQRGEVFLTLKMGRFFGSGSRETSEAVGEIRILTNSATQNKMLHGVALSPATPSRRQ